MARYLIEVPHEPEKKACLSAIEVFLKMGSHYLTHCDWGCMDGDHRAWIIVDVDSKEEALRIVPPQFRAEANVILTNKFTMELFQELSG